MNSNTPSNPLADTLQKFESNLETPIVPGEISGWTGNLRESCKAVGRRLTRAINDSHEGIFRQIREQDPELLPRVEQLRGEDQELLEDFRALERDISDLEQQIADGADPHRAESLTANIVKQGLAFVIRARTQETTLTTWYVEAFQRDRGIAD